MSILHMSFHFIASIRTTCKRELKFWHAMSFSKGESSKGFVVYNQEFPRMNLKVILWQQWHGGVCVCKEMSHKKRAYKTHWALKEGVHLFWKALYDFLKIDICLTVRPGQRILSFSIRHFFFKLQTNYDKNKKTLLNSNLLTHRSTCRLSFFDHMWNLTRALPWLLLLPAVNATPLIRND